MTTLPPSSPSAPQLPLTQTPESAPDSPTPVSAQGNATAASHDLSQKMVDLDHGIAALQKKLLEGYTPPRAIVAQQVRADIKGLTELRDGQGNGIDINPDQVMLQHFAEDDPKYAELGFKPKGQVAGYPLPTTEAKSLTQAVMDNLQEKDLDERLRGGTFVVFEDKQGDGVYRPENRLNIDPRWLPAIARNRDFGELVDQRLKSYWSSNHAENRQRLIALNEAQYKRSALNDASNGKLSEQGLRLAIAAATQHKSPSERPPGLPEVKVSNFSINSAYFNTATDIHVIEGKTGLTLMHKPNGEHDSFYEFANRGAMHSWIREQAADSAARAQLLEHFSLYDRRDGTVWTGAENGLMKIGSGEWSANEAGPSYTIRNNIFEDAAQRTINRSHSDAAEEIKSNRQLTVGHINRIAAWGIAPGGPITRGIFGSEQANHGHTAQERKEGFNHVVSAGIESALGVLPLTGADKLIGKLGSQAVQLASNNLKSLSAPTHHLLSRWLGRTAADKAVTRLEQVRQAIPELLDWRPVNPGQIHSPSVHTPPTSTPPTQTPAVHAPPARILPTQMPAAHTPPARTPAAHTPPYSQVAHQGADASGTAHSAAAGRAAIPDHVQAAAQMRGMQVVPVEGQFYLAYKAPNAHGVYDLHEVDPATPDQLLSRGQFGIPNADGTWELARFTKGGGQVAGTLAKWIWPPPEQQLRNDLSKAIIAIGPADNAFKQEVNSLFSRLHEPELQDLFDAATRDLGIQTHQDKLTKFRKIMTDAADRTINATPAERRRLVNSLNNLRKGAQIWDFTNQIADKMSKNNLTLTHENKTNIFDVILKEHASNNESVINIMSSTFADDLTGLSITVLPKKGQKEKLQALRDKFEKSNKTDFNFFGEIRKSRMPYVVLAKGKKSGAETVVLSEQKIHDAEKNLSKFSEPLEINQSTHVKKQKVEKQKPAKAGTVETTSQSSTRSAPAYTVEIGNIADTQMSFRNFPQTAINKINEVIEDITAGRITHKGKGNRFYYDLPGLDTQGRGRWRMILERNGNTFTFAGIVDYHGPSKPKFWRI